MPDFQRLTKLIVKHALVVVAKGRSKDACGLQFQPFRYGQEQIRPGRSSFDTTDFHSFPSFRLADFRNRLSDPQFCTKQSAASGFRNFEAGGSLPRAGFAESGADV